VTDFDCVECGQRIEVIGAGVLTEATPSARCPACQWFARIADEPTRRALRQQLFEPLEAHVSQADIDHVFQLADAMLNGD
jgi:hypothetical protein